MKSDAIKLELIRWLINLDDEEMLVALLHFKKTSELPDWADMLTPDQLSRIEEGIEDCKKGRTVKSEQIWKNYGR